MLWAWTTTALLKKPFCEMTDMLVLLEEEWPWGLA